MLKRIIFLTLATLAAGCQTTQFEANAISGSLIEDTTKEVGVVTIRITEEGFNGRVKFRLQYGGNAEEALQQEWDSNVDGLTLQRVSLRLEDSEGLVAELGDFVVDDKGEINIPEIQLSQGHHRIRVYAHTWAGERDENRLEGNYRLCMFRMHDGSDINPATYPPNEEHCSSAMRLLRPELHVEVRDGDDDILRPGWRNVGVEFNARSTLVHMNDITVHYTVETDIEGEFPVTLWAPQRFGGRESAGEPDDVEGQLRFQNESGVRSWSSADWWAELGADLEDVELQPGQSIRLCITRVTAHVWDRDGRTEANPEFEAVPERVDDWCGPVQFVPAD